jgi:F-box protein 11
VAEMQAAQVQDTSHCIIVAAHGDNVCRTIGEAVRLAHPGARILVQPGIYHEGIVLDKPLEILGDGLAEDIIIESSGVSCIHMQTDYALVRGLTLRGRVGPNEQLAVAVDIPRGRLVLEDCDIASDTLACVYVHTSLARPVLWRCSIHDSADAGIVFSQQSRGTVEQCDIADNEKSGIRILQGASPIIHDCTIHHGKYNGIYVGDRGAGTIESCDIFDNERTGIEISEESTPFIRNCRIHDQVTGYGIYVYERGSGIIEGCDISGNAQAGVRISESGNPFIRHCKIHDEKQVGIAMVENSQGILEGCDFFNNARTGVCIGESGTSGKREHPRNGDEYDETLVWDSEIENIEEWSIFRNAHAA